MGVPGTVAASTAPSPDLAATKCSGYNLEEPWSWMLGFLPLSDPGWLWQTPRTLSDPGWLCQTLSSQRVG